MKNIKEAAEKNPINQGLQLEGPFISVNYKGAQDASYIQKPDAAVLKHWNELSGNRIKLVTDSMWAKGMPEGKSELGGQTFYVKDGTARLEDGTIAGSVLTYIDAFRNIMKFTGASVQEAVQLSSLYSETGCSSFKTLE